MGAPHNKNKYGVKWSDQHYFTLFGLVLTLPDGAVISGGWAWCILTNGAHADYKHAHDLKDIDIFVSPSRIGSFVPELKELGWSRLHTKYDALSPFYRYVREENEKQIILDLFVKDVPSIEVGAFQVVEPKFLASLYGKHDPDSRLHGSGQCWSLALAQELLDKGEEVVGNPKMIDFSRWINEKN